MTRPIALARGARSAKSARTSRTFAHAMVIAPILLWSACAMAGGAGGGWRTIVIKGGEMPQLVGTSEKHLEVMALHGGRLAPIPFQVDEMRPDGRYALPDGPEPLADDSPGILDRDDEVAMMLSDLGDRASPPPPELPAGALEIEVRGAAPAAPRYAYIARAASPRLSPASYIDYDPARGRITAGTYQMMFRGDFPTGLALRGADGRLSPNLVAGSQVRVTARVLMVFKLHLGASGVSNSVMAWHRGPIRLIRRVSHSVKLAFGIKTPRVLSEEIFYREYAEDSFTTRVLWMPRVFFGNVRVRTWLDFTTVDGFTLLWSGIPRGLQLGAEGAAAAGELLREPPVVKWLALKGDGKIVMQTFRPSPDLATLRRQLYYCDPAAAPAAAARVPGCAGRAVQIGYLVTGWENLAAGAHRLDSVLMILPDSARPDLIQSELAERPTVAVRPVAR